MECLSYCDGFLILLLKLSVLLLCFDKDCAKYGFGTLLPPTVLELVHSTLDCTTQLFHISVIHSKTSHTHSTSSSTFILPVSPIGLIIV